MNQKCENCVMAPTMKLRWGDATIEDEQGNNKVPLVTVRSWESSWRYKLQQWWEDDAGKGEWRDIHFD